MDDHRQHTPTRRSPARRGAGARRQRAASPANARSRAGRVRGATGNADGSQRPSYRSGEQPATGFGRRPRAAHSASVGPRARDPRRAIAFIIVLVAVVALIGLSSSRCSSPDAQRTFTPYESPYDWTALDWSDGEPVYYQGGQATSRIGVDVSSHQGWIDWNAVAADGIGFAFVRVGNRGYTEGAISADEYFDYNVDAAASAGLDVGVYFFSQATTPDEAREEAQFVIEQLAGRDLALPVVFDHEPVTTAAGRANEITGDELAACVDAFCEAMEAAGYQTMVYGNRQDMARITPIDGSAEAASALAEEIGGRSVWLAEYDVTEPTAAFDFSIWQYTNAGTVNGIDTPVDLNIELSAR